MISVQALPNLPEVKPGDDLSSLLLESLKQLGNESLVEGDVLVLAQKVVSKAEGRVLKLSEVVPGREAHELSEQLEADPRVVEVVLGETAEVLRAQAGRLICRTHHGMVCSNAGVDSSNAGTDGAVILLPVDPDGSARRLRAALTRELGVPLGVIITDSFGRPWRVGQAEIAIGCAGVSPIDDKIGEVDSDGLELAATVIAVADQIASAADLVRSKASREPAIRVRGLARFVTQEDGPGAAAIVRDPAADLFR